ncbi:MAG: hypothetical protein J6Y78_15925 [Paludibacteraceae bacterium]|nr:hypothetical protein [Paludibacteraceae bacterium]
MKNGNEDFETALLNAESIAEKYELQLPHVSDVIYALVKLARSSDKNIKSMAKTIIKQQRMNKELAVLCKRMSRYLTGTELHKVERYMKKRGKKK